jgi:hypothetical protein
MPQLSKGAVSPGPSLSYRVTLPEKAPPFTPRIAEHLKKSGRFAAVTENSSDSELQLNLTYAWHTGSKAKGISALVGCILTLNLIPCWGTVYVETTAEVSRSGGKRYVYKVRHRYREYFWMVFLMVGQKKPGLVEMGDSRYASLWRITQESLDSVLARMQADGLLDPA